MKNVALMTVFNTIFHSGLLFGPPYGFCFLRDLLSSKANLPTIERDIEL